MKRAASGAFPAHYRTLEVDPRARPSVIRAAFDALDLELNPDKNADVGDPAALREVLEAYDVLSDTRTRAAYDKPPVAKGTVIGNYRILGKIAEGGFGTTYRAEHTLAGEPVCVKHCHEVSPSHEEILRREAKAVWDLRHYSLPVMRDLVRLDDGSLALVMSYIPGPTLDQIVRKNGRMDPENVAWIVERVLNALKYLHFNGVVHGDIKPQNIIVQPDTHQVVLVDFGLSMVKPTHTSDPKGYTPVFSPPEQLSGSPLVPESDFFSLGMTMLFALSGNVEAAVRMEVPINVPDVLCAFTKRLLQREVRNRPSWSGEDLCETIKTVRADAFGRGRSGMKPIPGF